MPGRLRHRSTGGRHHAAGVDQLRCRPRASPAPTSSRPPGTTPATRRAAWAITPAPSPAPPASSGRPIRTPWSMLRYNRGYKAFGFNAGPWRHIAPEAQPEHVDDFEVGVKKTFGQTLIVDADAFYYNYINDQTPDRRAASPASSSTEFINIPKAVSDGFELTANWTPIEHLQPHAESTASTTRASFRPAPGRRGGAATGVCYAGRRSILAGQRAPGTRRRRSAIRRWPACCVQAVNGDELPQAPENKVAFNATLHHPLRGRRPDPVGHASSGRTSPTATSSRRLLL